MIGVHVESPVEVTSDALEVLHRTSRAMQSKLSNGWDELELGLFQVAVDLKANDG